MATAAELERHRRLDSELSMISTTLDHSDELISGMKFTSTTGHILEPLLALGLERLVKVTYGLAVESDEGRWPGERIKRLKHGIHRGHVRCLSWIDEHLDVATHPLLITTTREQIDNDPVADLLLRHLENYAFNGRFFNLDGLAGGEKDFSPSAEFWTNIDQATVKVARRDLARLPSDDEWSPFRNRILQTSLRRIRTFYFQAWIQGVCGPTAKRYAFAARGEAPQLHD